MKLRIVDYPKELRILRALSLECVAKLLQSDALEFVRGATSNFGVTWELKKISNFRDTLIKFRLHEGYKLLIEIDDRDVFEKMEIMFEAYAVSEGRNSDLEITLVYHDNDTE